MAVCLYIWPRSGAWYICYVRAVQHAGRAGVFGRQRHQRTRAGNARPAADDDHYALADPVGKLISGLRVSSVLTLFLLWPVLLACVMVSLYWSNLISVLLYPRYWSVVYRYRDRGHVFASVYFSH